VSNYMDAISEIRKEIREEKAQWASRERGLSYEGKLRVTGRMCELCWMQDRLAAMVRRHKKKGAK